MRLSDLALAKAPPQVGAEATEFFDAGDDAPLFCEGWQWDRSLGDRRLIDFWHSALSARCIPLEISPPVRAD